MYIKCKSNIKPVLLLVFIFISTNSFLYGKIEDKGITIVIKTYNIRIHSGEEKSVLIEVMNNTDTLVKNIELVVNTVDKVMTKLVPDTITSLHPGEITSVLLEISSQSVLFQEDHEIVIAVKSKEHYDSDRLHVVLLAPRHTWMITGIAITVIVIIFSVLLFLKINKDPKGDPK